MAPRQPLPNISEDDLIDLAGGATVLLAKELVAKGKVKKALWVAPVAEALVDDGTESREARWNLRSITFQRNECGCDVSVGRRKLCVHSVAAYLALAASGMFVLSTMKYRLARRSGSEPLQAEATLTLVDGMLASGILAVLLISAWTPLWWVDPLAALLVAVVCVVEANAAFAKASELSASGDDLGEPEDLEGS
jgi:hypothetical protein